MQILKFFDSYTALGLQIIPLYARSKVPVGKGWNNKWNRETCRQSFEKYPHSNMGLLLGPFVDVEGDTDKANDMLFNLTSKTPHPMYRSSKSVHHLFINPDPDLTIFKFQNIEFRAHRHQSVLPPSLHSDGAKYAWSAGTKFPIPLMPDALLDFYQQHSRQLPLIKPGHIRPWCSVCGKRRFIHKKRYHYECIAFSTLGCRWQCHRCREYDVRELCRKLRKQKSLLP